MASIGHLAAGAVCGAVYSRATGTKPASTVAACAALGLAPDLDFLLISFNPFGTPFAHRVLTHSLPFAVVIGLFVGCLARVAPHRLLLSVLVALALASHGLLDALTRSGGGPELLWPFSPRRFAFAWQPIPGMQSFQEYFTLAAVPVYAQELLLHTPLIVAAALILWWRRPLIDSASILANSRGSGALENPQTPLN